MPSRSTLALAAVLAFPSTRCQTAVTITIEPGSPGRSVPADFLGLSYETTALIPGGAARLHPGNPVIRQLLRNLAPGVLRFGGDSVDHLSGWSRKARAPGAPAAGLAASDIDAGMELARASGWHVLWSIDLKTGTPASAADQARYVLSTAGNVVDGIAIGNEPNLYRGTTAEAFELKWRSFRDAILAAAPNAVIVGWDTTRGALTARQRYFAQTVGAGPPGDEIALLTSHLYSLNHRDQPGISELLGPAAASFISENAETLRRLAASHHIRFRLTETNNIGNGGGGLAGVSDTFASALWVVDFLYLEAEHSAAGVNFHCGNGGMAVYAPFQETRDGVRVLPEYYGMLLFHHAALGRLVPVTVGAGGLNIVAYGTVDANATLRLAVVNKERLKAAALTVIPGGAYAEGRIMRLSAPQAGSKSDVRFGGAAIAADGTWSPAVAESVAVREHRCAVAVPAASAVLIEFSARP